MSSMNTASRSSRFWNDQSTFQFLAYVVVILAGGWWLLGQLAIVLRPLLIAIFLCYVLLPSYSRLRRRQVPSVVCVILLSGSAIIVIFSLSMFVYANVLSLAEEGPELQAKAINLIKESYRTLGASLPDWMTAESGTDTKRPEVYLAETMPGLLQGAVNIALGSLIEACVAGLYLLFLLMGAERLPMRVRRAYEPERADQILHVAGRINSAIIGYLKAKCLSSLIFAVPVFLLLTIAGVKFALLWAVVTFACNFIPYVGSVIAYSLPTVFIILQFEGTTQAFVIAAMLLAIHLICATLIEPMVIGRAVGISPLIVLAALAVWGLIWGILGMILAVPLTVVIKIVLENLQETQPIAKLIEE